MRIEDIAKKLDEAFKPENKQARYRLARDLGWDFPNRNLKVISEFRSQVARRLWNESDPEIRGFFQGILEVAAAYEVAVEQILEREEIEKTARERGWADILLSLLELPKRTEELAPATKREAETLKQELLYMCVANLVEIYTGSPLYSLTCFGRELARKLKPKP